MNITVFCMKMGMKELAFSRNLWISHTVLYGAFSALFSTSRIQPCGRRPVCMQPCSLPQSANHQSDCASNRRGLATGFFGLIQDGCGEVDTNILRCLAIG